MVVSEEQLQELTGHLESPQASGYMAWLEQHAPTEAMDTFFAQRDAAWEQAMASLTVTEPTYERISQALQQRLTLFEQAIQDATGLESVDTEMDWQRVVDLLHKQVPELLNGHFLKAEVLHQLLVQHPPERILTYLGYDSIQVCLQNESIFEIYAALRFAETGEWMDAFLSTYSALKAEDFEARDVTFLRLDPTKWWKLAKPFALKKKHHFSHLKEAGVIFTYPAPIEDATYRPLHTLLAMAFHYMYEVRYYSDFFALHISSSNTPDAMPTHLLGSIFIDTLRGDVDVPTYRPGLLPIIQQYHLKHPDAPAMAYAPHVMPEAMHWQSALRELVTLVGAVAPQFTFMNDCYAVARVVDGKLLSLHLADVMLSVQDEVGDNMLTYHYKEDLWNTLVGLLASPAALRLATIQGLAKKSVVLSDMLAKPYKQVTTLEITS